MKGQESRIKTRVPTTNPARNKFSQLIRVDKREYLKETEGENIAVSAKVIISSIVIIFEFRNPFF